MLQSLSIKNVALITKLTIDFSAGLNVFLGETGAGKSIIFDSLNFVLGGKSDKSLIRYGETEMRVDAVFCGLSENVQSLLEEVGVEGDEIVITRTLTADGKSSIRINGLPTVQAVLKKVGQALVDSYSQHESVELLKSKNHLSMLDKFGGEKIEVLKNAILDLYNQEKELTKKISEFGGNEFERERMKSLLEYQIEEIENANLQIGEEDELTEKLKYMQSAEKIYEAVSSCEDLLNNGTSSCIRELSQASSLLSSLSSFDEINECKQRLDSARYEIEDISQTLLSIKESSEYDEREFERIDRRLDVIKSITKKYGGSTEKVLEYFTDAKEKYNALEDGEYLISKFEKEKKACYDNLISKCNELTALRHQTAREIQDKVVEELRQLGMKSSLFEVKIEPLSKPTTNGMDDVEFIFSANKGQELKSLSKTASGGELSRFMLAVKNIFSQIGDVQTLVFDEIDSGISGETGNIVGQKLNRISKHSQILCITHLPQVASYANSMYYVSKREVNDSTQTEIKVLNEEDIVLNIAKMVVGDEVSETSLTQAKEMRKKALNFVC